jgi:hypothetical protein
MLPHNVPIFTRKKMATPVGEQELYAQIYDWKQDKHVGKLRHQIADEDAIIVGVIRRNLITREAGAPNMQDRWVRYFASHIKDNPRHIKENKKSGPPKIISVARVISIIEAKKLKLGE